jgi:putative transport protein
VTEAGAQRCCQLFQHWLAQRFYPRRTSDGGIEPVDVFVDNELLTLFFCVGVGVAFGMIRFGPVSFGPAGALFAGLALSAANADVGLDPVYSSIGLCVFCYMVGLAAGPSFVTAVRTSYQPLLVALTAILAMAAGGLALGRALGVDIAYIAGAYAGSGTATPALGAVQQQLAEGGEIPPEPAVGYAVAYPLAVLITVLGCVYLMNAGKRKPTAEDSEHVPSLVVKTIEVSQRAGLTVAEMRTEFGAVVSRITRGDDTVVARADTAIEHADLITVTLPDNRLRALVDELGELSDREPWHDRSQIDFRRVAVSKHSFVGKTLAELELDTKFDAAVSRVRRGDVDLIAEPDLVLQIGDRLRVTARRDTLPEITKYLGDSERAAGDINALGLGLGLTIGLLFGLLSVPLPGGGDFVLGTATGPLIIGVVLGAIGRTGPIVWQLPGGVNNAFSQIFLLIFLAAVGTGSGANLVDALSSDLGLRLLAIAVTFCVIHLVVNVVGLRSVLRYGTARSLGGLTGSQLNPAPFAYSMDKVGDQRIAVLYAMIFPVIMLGKVILAQLMVIYF